MEVILLKRSQVTGPFSRLKVSHGPFSRLKVSYGAEGPTEGRAALFGPTRSIVPIFGDIGEMKVKKVKITQGYSLG